MAVPTTGGGLALDVALIVGIAAASCALRGFLKGIEACNSDSVVVATGASTVMHVDCSAHMLSEGIHVTLPGCVKACSCVQCVNMAL